jgi:glycosyltransferase involved in cell wall biosynthesis
MTKRALITGVTGQHGSYLSEFLLARMGIPVIGTDVGGTPDIIELGAGQLVAPKISPGDLAQCVAHTMDEPDRLAELQEEAWRSKHNASWRLVLLQFGNIKPYKGVDLLLEALTPVPSALRERLDVRIIGKPYMDTAELEHFARCVAVLFEFVSEAEEERLFAEADAIVLLYRDIDASGVATSAVACGVPVLATAIPGFRELFERKGGARLLPPCDPAALAKAMTDWVNAPEQLHDLAEAMRLRRAGIPSWDEIARRHLAVYEEARARWMANRREDGSSLAVRQTS